MQKTQQSNYDKLCEDWREKFLQMDQEILMRKLPEIKAEGEYLTIVHFGKSTEKKDISEQWRITFLCATERK